MIAQRRRPQWDLIHGSQKTAMQLGAMGLLVKWEEDRIPNLENVHPSFRYDYLAGKIHTPYGLAVNTKRITREIDSWEDLWDPAFKGKVAFPIWKWMGKKSSTISTSSPAGRKTTSTPVSRSWPRCSRRTTPS